MRLFKHRGRHIVVADLPETFDLTEETQEVEIVARVGVAPGVEGKARRGRPPSYRKPIPASELEALDHSLVGEETLAAARSLVDADPSEPSTTTESTESEEL